MQNVFETLNERDVKLSTHLNKIRDKLWITDSKSRVTVMVGAGFSKNATKIEPSFEGMALWEELKEQMIKDLSHYEDIEDKDVLEIAQTYSNEYGRSSLDELLKISIPDNNFEPDALHSALLNLPWTDIFTTNYDTLLERAKKNVFERNYQVIYDINDIPSSVQPRIVKLHGSFPANRPFIFTKKDYESYPEKFSPFINMVQQSIMETTFVLIGFSGTDPNFTKWISWVQNNLKEHMPKIYMIGYNEGSRRAELEEKGITLIDLKKIYMDNPQSFKSMFHDLFEFLMFRDRTEKIKWPHQTRINIEENLYNDNRETYPGWVIMPDEIRKNYSKIFWEASLRYIMKINPLEINNSVITKIKDTIWYYDKFHIPLNSDLYNKLGEIVDEFKYEKTSLTPIVLRLLKEARLRYDFKNFFKYKDICTSENLDNEDSHTLKYELILFQLDLNEIEGIIKSLEEWEVGTKELDWGIKKACIYTRINKLEDAEVLFEGYLQTVRRLLAIKMDDYRLLSLESIILHHLSDIEMKSYGKDRLRTLSTKYCDAGKEFNSLLRSIKEYNVNYGFKKSLLFDRGREVYSTNFNSSYDYSLGESLALTRMKEEYNFHINDGYQYEIALKNLHYIYPEYSLIKRMQKIDLKGIKNLLTREYVYHMGENEKEVLIKILKHSLIDGIESTIQNKVALEIYSRIYMILDASTKKEVDDKIFKYIDDSEVIKREEIKSLRDTISRIFDAKNPQEAMEFTQKIIGLKIKSQNISDKSIYKTYFFDPILEIFNQGEKVSGMKVSAFQLENLLNTIENIEDQSMVESAFLRLAFLSLTGSLHTSYRERFKVAIETIEKNRSQGISDFIRVGNVDNLVNGTDNLPRQELDMFLTEEVPIFYKENSMSDGFNVIEYFRTTRFLFNGLSELDVTKRPTQQHYIKWLDKFYIWWDSQKKGLLKDVNYVSSMIPIDSLLLNLIITLKNNIWGTIPLDYLREEDRLRAKSIFNEIFSKEQEKAMLLIPSLQRMGIEMQYKLKYSLESLSDPNIEKSKYSIISLYDFVIFIYKNEIDEDLSLIKEELLHILMYASNERLNEALKTFIKIIELDLELINDELVSLLVKYSNRFLTALKNDDSLVENREDFEVLGSQAKLVAVLIEKKPDNVGEAFEEWKRFIQNHKLPEVRSALVHMK